MIDTSKKSISLKCENTELEFNRMSHGGYVDVNLHVCIFPKPHPRLDTEYINNYIRVTNRYTIQDNKITFESYQNGPSGHPYTTSVLLLYYELIKTIEPIKHVYVHPDSDCDSHPLFIELENYWGIIGSLTYYG